MRFVKRAGEDRERAAAIAGGGISPLLASILAMRGVENAERAEAFLNPSEEQLHDPLAMKGMAEAVEAIQNALQEKKRIVVFGDYDVDGVTATAALLSQLREMGAVDSGYYLPDRHGEGYGLNETAVKSLASAYDMMITVDCGITAAREVAIAKENGLEVIVTDHHEPTETLPDCICLNPKLGYPFPDLCGAGVAGKLIQALGGAEALRRVLDLVALGTLADIVPLLDENRVMAALGLRALGGRMRPGISALAEVSGLLGKPISAGQVSFAIAPRINAGGRMGHSGKSVEMLLEADRGAAMVIARELDGLNRERQRQEAQIMQEAQATITKMDLRDLRCIVVEGEGWNPGVIGIVASRLVERFHKPVFLLAREGDAYTGSGRSIPGVHLFKMLDSMPADTFLRYGGHEMAAGLSIRPENVGLLRGGAQDFAQELPAEVFLPTARYDIEAELEDLDLPLIRQLEKLHPTGQGNPQPVFLLRSVYASGARLMGATGAHMRVTLSQGPHALLASAFKMGERVHEAKGLLDVLGNIEEDTFNGNSSARLILRAFEPSREGFAQTLRAEGDSMLWRFLQSLDMRAAPGFRHYIALRDREHFYSVLEGMLRQGGGVLVQCALPETALEIGEGLKERGLDALITPRSDLPAHDPTAPNTLLCPAISRGIALSRYRQILLPDGVWVASWAEEMHRAAPDAVIYAPPIPQEAREAMKAHVPTVDEARALYRVLRARAVPAAGSRDFQALFAALGVPFSQAKLHIALCMLRDMELVDYRTAPFTFSLLPPPEGKKDFEKTPTYAFFTSLIYITESEG